MRFKPAYLFFILCSIFIAYSFSVYTSTASSKNNYEKKIAADGKLVWQKYNCQSCHQLYGLGGYLGPDLTNIWSVPHRGPAYMKALLMAGGNRMPDFHLKPAETQALLDYFRYIDSSSRLSNAIP